MKYQAQLLLLFVYELCILNIKDFDAIGFIDDTDSSDDSQDLLSA